MVTQQYVLAPTSLVSSIDKASKFKSIASAQNAWVGHKDTLGINFVIISSDGNHYDVMTKKIIALDKYIEMLRNVQFPQQKPEVQETTVPEPIVEKPVKATREQIKRAENAAQNLSDNIEAFASWLTAIVNDSACIGDAHANIDKEIVDVYHTIELSTFNACEGYKLAKRLQDTLKRRRVIKDSEAMLPLLADTAKNIKKAAESKNKRTYTYRVVTDLEIKEPKKKKNTKKEAAGN